MKKKGFPKKNKSFVLEKLLFFKTKQKRIMKGHEKKKINVDIKPKAYYIR